MKEKHCCDCVNFDICTFDDLVKRGQLQKKGKDCYIPKDRRVNYTIISKPVFIRLKCPYCHENIEFPFCDDYWYSGEYCDCPKCGFEIELGDWEYD